MKATKEYTFRYIVGFDSFDPQLQDCDDEETSIEATSLREAMGKLKEILSNIRRGWSWDEVADVSLNGGPFHVLKSFDGI